jgi:hypothetical protein
MVPVKVALSDVTITTQAFRAWEVTCRSALGLLPSEVTVEDPGRAGRGAPIAGAGTASLTTAHSQADP